LIEPTIAATTVGEQHLAVELQALELPDLDADVVQDPQTADALDELVLLQRVGRPREQVHPDPAARGAHEAFQDDGVLVAFVLDELRCGARRR
jgi:hypothetical protein